MKRVSAAVAFTLHEMQIHAQPGMSTLELDEYGGNLLRQAGAQSAPKLTYDFPGYTCISVNKAMAHGIPSKDIMLQEGDLINIDVSAMFEGFWSDNGASFVLGKDLFRRQPLVNASRKILHTALAEISDGARVNQIGRCINRAARKQGYRVIRNLAGHGVGRSLHESPHEILNYYDPFHRTRLRENDVIAVETFISTRSDLAIAAEDGWTLIGNKGGYVAQHEHTLVVTKGQPIILTAANQI
jgi:methionyl aminopeptidase